ncbi:DUF4360 domain-containing protein [Actinomadura roseirufa]|uniref:DUF4360 domain-containing protein n=1 Tax=Actinomadura roseirufa TaxID=2094049 RepID=UPI0013F15D10|nr:DUF4360 domain-containing protein [Actinomadura roseirufa]
MTALTPAPASAAQEDPPDGSVHLSVAALSGSGCRPGSVAVTTDIKTIFVSYDKYLAVTGSREPRTPVRADCRVTLRITYPPEFTYGIVSAGHRGAASIEEGATGSLKSRFLYPGQRARGRDEKIPGPFHRPWNLSGIDDLPYFTMKPCDLPGDIVITTELGVDPGTSDKSTASYMDFTRTSSDYGSSYFLYWTRCPETGRR